MPSILSTAWIPLKKDAALPQPSGRAPPAGMQGAYHGKSLDANEPPALEILTIWESLDAVKAAHASPEAAQIKAALESLADTSNPALKPRHNVFTLNSDAAAVVAAPVTQLSAFVLPTSVSKEDFAATFEESVKGSAGVDGVIAGAHGFSEEQVDLPDGSKANVFLIISGWESIEKAKAAREGSKAAFAPMAKFGDALKNEHVRYSTFTKVP